MNRAFVLDLQPDGREVSLASRFFLYGGLASPRVYHESSASVGAERSLCTDTTAAVNVTDVTRGRAASAVRERGGACCLHGTVGRCNGSVTGLGQAIWTQLAIVRVWVRKMCAGTVTVKGTHRVATDLRAVASVGGGGAFVDVYAGVICV